MKKIISTLIIVAVLATASTLTTNAAIQVYDLKTDWSDTQNPNGTWSYRDAGGALLSNNPFPWTYGCEVLEAIARVSQASVVPGSLELGDIRVLTGSCGVMLRWTAPANGTINVFGNLWGCNQAIWTLTHNGSVLSSGDNRRVDPRPTRDLPYYLSSGSGGAAALQSIAVQAGEQVEIVVLGYTFCFDQFEGVGLNFTITLTPASADPVAAIEDLALTVVHMNLQNGIENNLDSKLDAAVSALIDANVNNDGAACNSLAAFISAVQAQRGKKISNAQADQLIAAAQQIKAMLNCGN